MAKKLEVRSRIWITSEDGNTYLGSGRVQLLKAIDEHGSISKAAKEMKMSYKKAWKMVNAMNAAGDEVLVNPTSGGAGGGGTTLSEAGKEAIVLFTKLSEQHSAFLEKEFNELNS